MPAPDADPVGAQELTEAVQDLQGAYIDDGPADPVADASAAGPPGPVPPLETPPLAMPPPRAPGGRAEPHHRGPGDARREGWPGIPPDRVRARAARPTPEPATVGEVAGARRPAAGTGAHLPEAPLTVGAMAERLGIASSTLRSWDRRYGLGPTDHRPGARRRYGPADVVRLERMRALTLAGVSPADAARSVARRPGGYGDVMPVSVAARSLDVRSVAAAAEAGDRADVRLAVARHVEAHGWAETWRRLVDPACEVLSILPEPAVPGSDGITVLTAGVLEIVRTTVLSHVSDPEVRVVIHSAPKHVLAAHVLAGALAERGVASTLRRVGRRRVPAGAIEDLTGGTEGVAVVVGFGRAASVRALGGADPRRRPEVVLVGPGLPRQVPDEVQLASDLLSAVSAVTALLERADLA